jgi:MoxR-like ATPase
METRIAKLSEQEALRVKSVADRLVANVGEVMVGKSGVTELMLVALLCEGNVLVEDVPGVGKTVLARALAKSLGCDFRRIQCTPDLLPSDVTGVEIYNQATADFEFRPGPIMTNIVLVDEINRATPRTQSALLEAMQEQQITVDRQTVPLPRPFMLMATQNPIELEGTFPLPEAQLDRFMLRLEIGYPSEAEESLVLTRFRENNPLDTLEEVTGAAELLGLQKLCRQVYVDPSVRDYIVSVVRATREHGDVRLGASPRASLGLHRAAQALAAVRGRTHILPDDVKLLAVPALAHRLTVKTEARLHNRTARQIITDIANSVPVPVLEA